MHMTKTIIKFTAGVFQCTGTYLEATLLHKSTNLKPITPIVLQVASDHFRAETKAEMEPNHTVVVYLMFRKTKG